MASIHDSQVKPVPVNVPAKHGFLNGFVDIVGIRIPNVVLIILLVVIVWFLLSDGRVIHNLTPHMVGGALETSSSPTSSFFDNIRL